MCLILCYYYLDGCLFDFFLKKKTKLYGPFLRMGFNCLKVTEFTFYHSVPMSSWYSTDQLQKDERLS